MRFRLSERRWARLLRPGFRAPSAHNQTERNIWYLYVEVFWAAILSAAAAFNAAFALRLGATNAMMGWLSSIPALLATFMLIPAARFLERHTNRAPWIWGSLFLARLGYGVIVLIPWLLPSQHQAAALVGLLIAISIPTTFFSTGWSPLLADVIPERDRARVFANRSIIVGSTVALLTFLAGRWLDLAPQLGWFEFPANFQVLYALGFVGAVLSSATLLRIKVPPSRPVQRARRSERPRRSFAELSTAARAFVSENRSFVRITLNTLIFNFGEWLLAPLYIIFFVRQLEASDGWIGLNSTLANVGVILGYILWRHWIEKLGNKRTLLYTVPLSASYAFLISLFPNLTAILIFGVFINIVNSGVNLSHFNILLKLCPDDLRASYIAGYSTVINAGAFVGPMIGVALLNVLDLRWVLVLGGSIRLIGALLFHILKVEEPTAS